MLTLQEVQTKLGRATVKSIAVANKGGVKQAMLFLEGINGRFIRASVPWVEIEEAILESPSQEKAA